ncbi:hypothetical protein OFAG_02128 [Oxalobacter formigenes HOxBLS]|uniref:Uncharacterized protein n=1 Tax=Oxalobacter paraformigenes TaxID=556268 RepID=T5LQ04_9BURK|nr:hypothetical protein OFAG_02128 [Oxalobacter paraformigenes]
MRHLRLHPLRITALLQLFIKAGIASEKPFRQFSLVKKGTNGETG